MGASQTVLPWRRTTNHAERLTLFVDLIIVTTVWKRQQLGEELAQPCRALWQIDVSRLNLG